MPEVMGHQAKLIFGASNPPDLPLPFVSSDFGATRLTVEDDAITGTRTRMLSNTRQLGEQIAGTVVCRPTVKMLANLLPRIMGGTPVGTLYTLAETLPEFYLAELVGDRWFLWSGCRIASATFAAAAGSPWSLTLAIQALEEEIFEVGTDPFPVVAIDATTRAFILQDATVSVNGNAVCTPSIQFTLDNLLTPDEFENCTVGAADLLTTDRAVSLSLGPISWGRHQTLYPQAATGVPVVVTFTDGSVSAAFTFPKAVFEKRPPVVAGKRVKVRLPLNAQCVGTAPNDEMSANVDSTV